MSATIQQSVDQYMFTLSIAAYGYPELLLMPAGTHSIKMSDMPAIAESFLSGEAFSHQPGSAGLPQLIDQIYTNLFGRHVEDAGLQWWLQTAQQQNLRPAEVLRSIIDNAQGNDAHVLQNKASFADLLMHTTYFAQSSDGKYYYNSKEVKEADRDLLQTVHNDKSVDDATMPYGGMDKLLEKFHLVKYGSFPDLDNRANIPVFHNAAELIGVTHANSTPGPF